MSVFSSLASRVVNADTALVLLEGSGTMNQSLASHPVFTGVTGMLLTFLFFRAFWRMIPLVCVVTFKMHARVEKNLGRVQKRFVAFLKDLTAFFGGR